MDPTKYFEALSAKLDRQGDALASIDKILARQEENLKEHMRRTEVAEKRLDLFQSELAPLKAHVAGWSAVGKALAIIGTLVGIAVGVAKLIKL